MKQRSHCTKAVLLTYRWSNFVWLSNTKSFCTVIKYIGCISGNAVSSSLALLGKYEGFSWLFRKHFQIWWGFFLPTQSLQYKHTAHSCLQIYTKDYAMIAFTPGLISWFLFIFQLDGKCQDEIIGRKKQVVSVEERLLMESSMGQSSCWAC